MVTAHDGSRAEQWRDLVLILEVEPVEHTIELIMRCEAVRRREHSRIKPNLGSCVTKRMVIPSIDVETRDGTGFGWNQEPLVGTLHWHHLWGNCTRRAGDNSEDSSL